jgi:polar amino acid transport system substrate-binding protein
MRKQIALSAILLAGCGLAAGCGSGGEADNARTNCTPAHPGVSTLTDGTLTVAVATLPPFTGADGNELLGLEGDILSAIAERECLTIQVQSLDFPTAITAAQTGRADISSGNWWCTAKRAETMGLVGPVYTDKLGITSREGIDTFSAVEGRPVGTVDGYNWNADLEKVYGANLKTYPSASVMYQDLQAGRIDAAFDSSAAATYANQQRGGEWQIKIAQPDERIRASLKGPQVCFPVPANNASLKEALNADVEALRTEGALGEFLTKNELDPSAADTGPLNLID